MKEYFAENTMEGFKISKKFWDFYKSSIKIKSDEKTSNFLKIDTLKNGKIECSNEEEFGNMFNFSLIY